MKKFVLAWFGGDPHIQTLSNSAYSCNVLGSFIYAETTPSANNIARSPARANSNTVKALFENEVFSIIARTTKTPVRLPDNGFFNQEMTYFSSFSMRLGSNNDVVIDVDINPDKDFEFRKKAIRIHPATILFLLKMHFRRAILRSQWKHLRKCIQSDQ